MTTGGGGTGGAVVIGGSTGAGGAAGTDGIKPIGYCDTFADCALRSGCCGLSCQAKSDPPSSNVCTTSCAARPPSTEPPTCGCVDHSCSNESLCIVPGAGACPSCPHGYLPGSNGCPTCTCNPIDGTTTPLPACTWPYAVGDPDAGAAACRAARTVLSCKGPNGVTEECTSDDPSHCAGETAGPAGSFTCNDLCNPNEYGVICGAIGTGLTVDPPAGCHGALATPAGIVFFCCPCL